MMGNNNNNSNVESGESEDKVTISLYSIVEKDDKTGEYRFNKSAFSENANVMAIQEKLFQAAQSANREPPEIVVVSMLLIPNWTDSEPKNYESEIYKQLQDEFIKEAKSIFETDVIKVEDFYVDGHLSQDEKDYMGMLMSRGSTIDIIKTRAIINNQNCRHLQLDSNTKIWNYDALYRLTFGAEEQQDALNASFYDVDYISAHNKIVYTVPNGVIAKTLEKIYLDYCKNNKNNDEKTVASKNAIYSKGFSFALSQTIPPLTVEYKKRAETLEVIEIKPYEIEQLDLDAEQIYLELASQNLKNDVIYLSSDNKYIFENLSKEIINEKISDLNLGVSGDLSSEQQQDMLTKISQKYGLPLNENKRQKIAILKDKVVYKAQVSNPVYRITPYVITAINMSWSGASLTQEQQRNKDFTLIYKDIFVTVGDAEIDYPSFIYLVRKYTSKLIDKSELNELMNISDKNTDKEIMKKYFQAVIASSQNKEEKIFADFFPDTELGNILTQDLFGCSVKQLKENPDLVLEEKKVVSDIEQNLNASIQLRSAQSESPPSSPSRIHGTLFNRNSPERNVNRQPEADKKTENLPTKDSSLNSNNQNN